MHTQETAVANYMHINQKKETTHCGLKSGRRVRGKRKIKNTRKVVDLVKIRRRGK